MKYGRPPLLEVGKPPGLGVWPSKIGADALCDMVRELHGRLEDFHEGDLDDRLRRYDSYFLTVIDLEQIDADEWATEETLAETYALTPGDFPPIVFDTNLGSIIDGSHRVKGALRRGNKTIQAYCPILD